jgi:hypothetical protein
MIALTYDTKNRVVKTLTRAMGNSITKLVVASAFCHDIKL